MNTVRYSLVVALLVALGAHSALAGGYQLNEHGTRAMGMGGAFAAQASDGSAIFFNPAGLAFQQGFRALIGVTPILPTNKYESPSGTLTKMKKQTFFLPHAYASYGLDNGLTFGVGFYAPYGLGTEWPADWAGRYLAVKTDLKSFYVNPTIAYKINDKFAIGAGCSYVFSNVKLRRKIQLALPTVPPTLLPDGQIDLDGNGHGFDFSVGILTKPVPELSVGVSYRHSVKIDYDGDATFSDLKAYPTPYGTLNFPMLFPGGKGKTTITFPNNAFVGVCLQPLNNLTLEADFQYIEWLKYDTLKIDLPLGPTQPPLINRPLQGPVASAKDWDNTFIIRFGGEYELDKIAIRAGYIFDKSPQPSKALEPMLPDADRHEFTAGFGYQISQEFSVDVAYQIILFKDRSVGMPENIFPGTYKSTAHLFGLSLGYAMQ
jgi:long-chain fatty acid transport protein